MTDLFYFIGKMYRVTGLKLVINMLNSLLISCLDGIGIYLIIPLLSVLGIFSIGLENIPLLSNLFGIIESWNVPLTLPIVLSIYVLVVGGQALLQRTQAVNQSKILQGFVRSLRTETYKGLLSANWEFFLRKRKSDFNHMMVNELGRVSYGSSMFLQMISSFIFTVIQIGLSFWLSPLLTAVVLVSGGALALFSRKFIRGARKLGDQTSELSQQYFAGLADHFNGIKDIKSNRLEQSHIYWFSKLSKDLEGNVVKFVRLNTLSQFTYRLTSIALIAGFVYLALEVLRTPAEQLILVVLIFTRLWPRFIGIQSNIEQLVSNLPAFRTLRRLQQEYEGERELAGIDLAHKAEPIRMQAGIECRRVYFRYDRKQPVFALRDIHLHIPANQMTAIVGKSGAGKSTLIDMLMGLIHPERGQVLVDGVPLTDEKRLLSLRCSIGYVAQDPFLFNDSIRENLKLVDPYASDSELWDALKFAAADEFVRKLPQGLDTVIGDRGIRLSGGERQRIVLARAILKRPAVLVLDEATSALDSENERYIQEALERLKGSMTIIVIAHRLSTIRNADQVIVMEQGEIIQQGEYQQLSQETKGTFKKLLNYQTAT